MPPNDHSYKAFISYSHQDEKWAKWLHRSLERYVVPKDALPTQPDSAKSHPGHQKRLRPIFRDREDISASGSLALTIYEALESSENLIVLCSPSAAESQYVNAEIDIFRGLQPDNQQKIYALIVEGDPPDCFPATLTADGAEPIAADARESGDGKVDAKLKLIAGMLGVGFDRLKQREVKRQRNRLLTMVSVISAVAVMTSFLALWALKAENEASKQRELAEQQRGQAEQQRKLAEQQRELAEQSAAESKAVLRFFETKVLAAARPKSQAGGLGINATIRAAVDAAIPQIETAFTDQSLIEASIRHTLGSTYRYLGENQSAIEQNEQALELRISSLGREHRDSLLSMRSLAISYWIAGRFDDALQLNEEALQIARKMLGPEDIDTLGAMNELATSYQELRRYEEALSLFKETLVLQKKILGLEHPDTLSTMNNLANTYGIMRRHQQAVSLNEEALHLLEKLHGSQHPDTLVSMTNLAAAYLAAGQTEKALVLAEKTLNLQTRVLGADHPHTLKSMSNVALAYSSAGLHKEALILRKKALELRIKVLGTTHPDTLNSSNELIDSYSAANRHEDALQLRKKISGGEHPETLKLMSNLAIIYKKQKLYQKAVSLQKETLNLQTKTLGDSHPNTLISMNNLANMYETIGQPQQALKLREQTLDLQTQILGKEHADTLRSMNNLAVSYRQSGRHEEALHLCEKSFNLQQKTLGKEHPDTLRSMSNLAGCYLRTQHLDEAEELYRQLILIRSNQTSGDLNLFYAQLSLGMLLSQQKKYPEAETFLIAGHEGLGQADQTEKSQQLKNSLQLLIQLYHNWGKADKAAQWQAKLNQLNKGK